MPASIGTKSPTANTYLWIGPSGGLWGLAGNWGDATTGTWPASYVPGTLTPVTITGPTGSTFEVISGGGSAASMDLTGNVSLNGDYAIGGAFDVGSPTSQTDDALTLVKGSTVTAASVNMRGTVFLTAATTLSTPGALSVGSGSLDDAGGTVSIGGALNNAGGRIVVTSGGTLTVGGAVTNSRDLIAVDGAGSKLVASGVLTATDGGPYAANNNLLTGSVIAVNGGLVQLGGAVFNAATNPGLGFLGLAASDGGAIEVGNAGSAAFGAITIDAGKTIAVNTDASFDGALVNNGTVTVNGGTLTQIGDLSGSGTVQIGKNATLALNGTAAAADTIAFLDTGAALSIGTTSSFVGGTSVSTPYSVEATLTGFQDGASLILGTPVTAATYTAGTGSDPGTLTLSNGTTTVETLRLTGDFTGKNFLISPISSDESSISLVDQTDPLFDSAYYLEHNPDVAAAGVAPYQHYLIHGWKEGRDPSALFDTNYYLTQNVDVKAAGVDPLLHFEQNGWKEGRDPSLMFSDAKYLAANPDVKAAGIDPLLHYVSYGQLEGRTAFLSGGTAAADPLVDAAFYDRQLGATLIPTGVAAQQQAAASYGTTGWQKGLNPDAFFDTTYYLSHNADVAAAHINPLLHYEQYGWHEGRDPSAQFSTNKYLAANPDVKAAGVDPLLHYVQHGQAEGRTAFNA